MNISRIDANKKEEVKGGLKVNNVTNFKDVKEQDFPGLEQKGLAIGFEFKSDYVNVDNKNIAEIIITGEVLFLDPKHKELLEQWEKEKKFPDDINILIINNILRRCMIKALELSQELGLPPPIALPFASKKQEESSYIG